MDGLGLELSKDAAIVEAFGESACRFPNAESREGHRENLSQP